MKKALIALAVAAAVPALAQAQTNVTMFGVVDAAFQYSKGAGNGTNMKIVQSGYNSSRWGVRGTEAIGGGLNGVFWLESSLQNDDSTGFSFNNARRSYVGLSGGFGQVLLGREYTPSFWNHTVYDAFGTNGVGSGLNVNSVPGSATGQTELFSTSVRANNGIHYIVPAGLPVFGSVTYAFGEQGSTTGTANPAAVNANKNQGNYFGARIGGNFGPASIAGAIGQEKGAGTSSASDVNLGGSFKFGPATIMGLVDQSKVKNGNKRQYINLGTNIAVGAGTIRASITDSKAKNNAGAPIQGGARQLALGYVHDLSKRTAVYGTFSLLDNKNNDTARTNARAVNQPGGKATALELGVRHSF